MHGISPVSFAVSIASKSASCAGTGTCGSTGGVSPHLPEHRQIV